MVKKFFRSIKSIVMLLYYFMVMPEKKISRFPYINKFEGQKALVFGNGPSTKEILDQYKRGVFKIDSNSFFVNYAPLDPTFFLIKPNHFFLSDFVFLRDTHDSRTEMTRRMYNLLDEKVDWKLTIYLCFLKKKYCDELVAFSKIKNPNIRFVYLNRNYCSDIIPSLRHWLYKRGWFMPEEGTVVNTAIYVALIEGFKEVELYGVEHNMFLNLRMNSNHRLCILQKNFYDKEEKLVPVKNDGDFTQCYIHTYMSFIFVMFRSHYLLRQFADYLGAKIINCTPNSMIDVYEFKKNVK